MRRQHFWEKVIGLLFTVGCNLEVLEGSDIWQMIIEHAAFLSPSSRQADFRTAAVEFWKHLLDASSSLFAQGRKLPIQDVGFQVKHCFHGMQCYVLWDLMERKAHETRSTPS